MVSYFEVESAGHVFKLAPLDVGSVDEAFCEGDSVEFERVADVQATWVSSDSQIRELYLTPSIRIVRLNGYLSIGLALPSVTITLSLELLLIKHLFECMLDRFVSKEVDHYFIGWVE